MRKRIRLTGRKQLPLSAIEAKVSEIGEKKLVSLTLAKPQVFARMPPSARVKLRLIENKVSEVLEFGTLADLRAVAEMKNRAFAAPSCQLRVVASDEGHRGLLLGSTDTWTMRAKDDDQPGAASQGILMFQPMNIAPRSWKLEIREDDYPVVYIDSSIPESRTWVRNDPVFVSCVLPAIIREVFQDILIAQPEQKWAQDWIDWADTLMPGKAPPWGDGQQQKNEWIDVLLDSFCQRHGTLGMLTGWMKREAVA